MGLLLFAVLTWLILPGGIVNERTMLAGKEPTNKDFVWLGYSLVGVGLMVWIIMGLKAGWVI